MYPTKLYRISFFGLIIMCNIHWLMAQKRDTVFIDNATVKKRTIHTGENSYVVYATSKQFGSPQRMFLLNMYVTQEKHNNKDVYAVEQRWEFDTVFYTSLALFSESFATLYYSYWWKYMGYRVDYDFEKQSVNYEGDVIDSSCKANHSEFETSLKGYGYNCYIDLLLFPILPYKLYRTFLIRFNDPGYGKSQVQEYTVTGKEDIKASSGKLLSCWIVERIPIPRLDSYQKFWICAETGEVLRQEDYMDKTYRYRVKLTVHSW
jgi:hypothetical protein